MAVHFQNNLLVQTLLSPINEAVLLDRVKKLTRDERSELISALEEIGAEAGKIQTGSKPNRLTEKGIAVLLLVNDKDLEPVYQPYEPTGGAWARFYAKDPLRDKAIIDTLSATRLLLNQLNLGEQNVTSTAISLTLSNEINILMRQIQILDARSDQIKKAQDLAGKLGVKVFSLINLAEAAIDLQTLKEFNTSIQWISNGTSLGKEMLDELNKISKAFNFRSTMLNQVTLKNKICLDSIVLILKNWAKIYGFTDQEINQFLPKVSGKESIQTSQVLDPFVGAYAENSLNKMNGYLETVSSEVEKDLSINKKEKKLLESRLDLYKARIEKRDKEQPVTEDDFTEITSPLLREDDFTMIAPPRPKNPAPPPPRPKNPAPLEKPQAQESQVGNSAMSGES